MSVRIVSTPVVGSSLAQLGTSGAETPWFVRAPQNAEEWNERANLIRGALLHADWLPALLPAFGSGSAGERLQRAAASGFIVTAGQQPGLFGGPLYTWWKALSALALADALQDRTGLPVAPVFWAATDDSDFAESSSTIVATPAGAERIQMLEPPGIGVALAQLPLGDLSRELSRLETAAGSASSSEILSLARKAYSPTHTVGGAYIELLRSILEPLGISILDAAHPAVRRAAHPLLKQSLEQSERIEAALIERTRSLAAQGHSSQVRDVQGRTLAFSERNGKRDRVRISEAARTAAAAEPGTLGPNVLLRPIVERSIMPTVAYVGGPAEIAYFAQVTAVAGAMDVPAPLVVPRWSGFAIEPRVDRILGRYGFDVEDFRDPHAVETGLAKSSLPAELVERIAALRASLERSTAELAAAKGADLVPPSVLQGLTRNVSHRVERLERRFAAGVKRRGNEALRDAAIARGSLFPLGVPQERALNIVPLLARYGDDLLSPVMAEIRAHAAKIA